MATKTAVLAVRVVTDAAPARRGLDDTSRSVKSFSDSASKAALPAAGLAAAVGLIYKTTGDAASALQQSTGGVESVFKQYAGTVNQAAKDAALNVGLAASEYGNLSVVIGSQLKNMGIPLDQVAGKTSDLIGLGADLSATFGGTTSEAVEALSALLRGERDPIERYGVSINQAAVNAKLAQMGLSGLTGEAGKNATLQATLALLTQQTADATGQFGRESDTAAGAQQRANAQFENAKAALGEGFLPIMVIAADLFSKLAGLIEGNAGAFSAVTIALGIAAGALLLLVGVTKGYTLVTEAAAVAQTLWNLALDANPIGILILLLIALGAAIAVIVTHWDTVAAAGEAAWAKISKPIQPLIDGVADLFGWIQKVAGAFLGIDGLGGYQAPDSQTTFARAAAQNLTASQSFSRVAAADLEGVSSAPIRRARPAAQQAGGDTFNVNVYGAIDKDGTARAIQKVVNQRNARNGTRPAATTRSVN